MDKNNSVRIKWVKFKQNLKALQVQTVNQISHFHIAHDTAPVRPHPPQAVPSLFEGRGATVHRLSRP